MSTIKYYIITITLFCCLFFQSCKKYLDEKQDQKLVVPTTVQDLQSLLDNWTFVNGNYPESGELSSDDWYLIYSEWNSRSEYIKRTYTWEKDYLFNAGGNNSWSFCYRMVYVANTVLHYIDKIEVPANEMTSKDNTKGSAYFLRGMSFANAAWIWCLAYEEATASADMGIPLRLDPNFNTPSVRANLKNTYNQIINDLKEAANLLPEVPVHPIRPSKSAAYGWLARTYLSMRSYDSALVYASKYLDRRSELLNFNNLSQTSNTPIASFNKEVAYHTVLNTAIAASRIRIDTVLYNSYDANDLRKTIFYRPNPDGTFQFKGSYDGSTNGGVWFNGIATDEMYLIRAECFARKGNTGNALADLNALLVTRWKNNGSWTDITASSANDALNVILKERRKELTQRGLRWLDIKRLNKEGAGIVLKRNLNSQSYILEPNDLKYALPIPEDVVAITGMPQNPR